MKIVITYVLAIGFVGSSAMLFQQATGSGQSIAAQQAGDGAFRDGLYLGKLARRANSPMNAPIGRWSTEKDRASFLAGYRQGFNEENAKE
jgi:hypothetical protein